MPFQIQSPPNQYFEKMRESLYQEEESKPKPFFRYVKSASRADSKCNAASQTSTGFSPSMAHYEASLPEILMMTEASPTKSHSFKQLLRPNMNLDQVSVRKPPGSSHSRHRRRGR